METQTILTTFPEVYRYVNERYVFTKEVCPVMGKINDDEQKIFIIGHIMKHLQKAFHKKGPRFPAEKSKGSYMQFLMMPDQALSSFSIDSKHAYLKMVINIMALCHLSGIDQEMIDGLGVPDVQPKGFNDLLENEYMAALATITETSDHTSRIDMSVVKEITLPIYLNMLYWFDNFWLPGFLEQIPTVMKS